LCENSSLLTLRNAIFFGNRVDRSTDSTDIVALASTIDIANTITQAYQYGNPSMTGANPKFLDTASVAGPDGFYFTTDDGLQLVNPCSPAINAGQNSAAVSLIKIYWAIPEQPTASLTLVPMKYKLRLQQYQKPCM
jgi:hypothetical protein